MESPLTPNYVALELIALSMTPFQMQTEKVRSRRTTEKAFCICHCSFSSLDLTPRLHKEVLAKRDFFNPRIPHNSVEGFLLYAAVRI